MTEPKTFIAALEEIKRLKAKNAALNGECDKAKNYMLTLGRDINEKAKEIAELKVVIERLTHWTPFISGRWVECDYKSIAQWYQKEMKARIKFAADVLERVKN